jgi:hypothetical protein
MELWAEYITGIEGNKPARFFTPSERGKVKHTYCRRKLAWDCIAEHVRAGFTPQAACAKIHQAYGFVTITQILNKFRADRARGGHPNLRIVRAAPWNDPARRATVAQRHLTFGNIGRVNRNMTVANI